MMNIPRVAHKVYANTFLGMILTRISYTASFDDSLYDKFESFFKDNYNFTISKEQYSLLQYHSLRFIGEDERFKIKLGKGFIEISMDGEVYVSFRDSLMKHLQKFLCFLQSLNQPVSEVSIEKVNFFPIQLKTRDAYQTAITEIFSEPLVGKMPLEYSEKDFRFDLPIEQNNERKALLSFGWMTIEEEEMKICLVLDSKIISERLESLSIDEISQQLMEMNQNLFDVYHWAVADGIIKIMNEEEVWK